MTNSKINWDSEKAGTFTDARDGQTYKVVRIGNQVWLAENLNFTKDLLNVADIEEWGKLSDNPQAAAWCYYENREENGKKYGALYTYAAALQVAPEGWHLPTSQDFKDLLRNVGDAFDALTEGGHSGFNALFGGIRGAYQDFLDIGNTTGFWSASGMANSNYGAWSFNIGPYPISPDALEKFAGFLFDDKASGYHVRLILD